ncbi:MAG: ABC transporter substrate-binding protein [Hyphomicrobiales bacterium]|nr:ABC transporter substrate-binding protein [Hyphomicrobiales bacterium]MCP5000907.1 ABC transporter substrate-binding protein [Hyphomicrobiales bacterium]
MGRYSRILAIGTAICALTTSAAMADLVKIGVLAPLTGPTASDGEEFVRGARLAAKEANANGGIAGHTFEIVTADVVDHSAANVTSAVERLLGTEGVHIILTGYASLSMFEVELMAEANMPYIAAGPSPQFAGIVSGDPSAYDCCWSFTADFKGYETDVTPTIEALLAAGHFPLDNKTVAIISSDNPYSKTISEGMKSAFGDAGWTVTVDELVPFGPVGDWRPILAKVRENPPDVVINTDYIPSNAALFTNQFREDPTDSVVFLQYAPLVPEFVELTKENSDGILYNAIGATLDVDAWPRGQEVAKKYKDEYGVASGAYGTGLYEMATVYFEALDKVGDPTDHDAVGKAIVETKRPVTSGFLEFDPATHVARQGIDHVPVTFFQIQDGGGVMISPDKYKSGEFKKPGWMSE